MTQSIYKNYGLADIILFDTPGMEKSVEFPKNLNQTSFDEVVNEFVENY